MQNEEGDVFTIDELAAYLKVSKSTLYKVVREGKVPCQKVGRHWRFRKTAIDRWLEGFAPEAAPAVKASRAVNGRLARARSVRAKRKGR